MVGPPGYSLPRLLNALPPERLREWLEGSVDLIEQLRSQPLQQHELAELVITLNEPQSLLLCPEKRRALLSQLPHEKRIELTTRLGGPIDPGDVHLLEIKPATADETALLAFFGYQREVGATESIPPQTQTVAPSYGLFDYQRAAASTIEEKLSVFPRRAVLHLPTGAGKTRTAMHVLCRHLLAGHPRLVVWLAYNQELLEQAASEFIRAWQHLGNREVELIRFWGESHESSFQGVNDGLVVGGLGKLVSRYSSNAEPILRLADAVTLTVFDEAHQAIAPTYRELADLFAGKRPGAQLLGLTATPGRTWAEIETDEELATFFGKQKVTLKAEGYSNPVRFLIDSGYLAEPSFRTLNIRAGIDLSAADRAALGNALDIPENVLARWGKSKEYTLRVIQAIVELIEDDGHGRILVFTSSVQQARTISAVLMGVGTEAWAVTAETRHTDRMRAIKRYRSNISKPVVLVNYGVLTTGFDAPGTSAAVIARATNSLVLYSQMVGRAIRGPRAGGNETSKIVTVVDPDLPGFGDVAEAFNNWEDVWNE